VITRRDAEMFHEYYAPGASPEDLRAPGYSPLYADLRGLPPTLLLVGTADPLLDDSLFAEARLRAADVAAELLVFPDAPHGFASFPTAYAAIAHRRAVAWITAR
jgi:acetyl esterase